jgi:hypothetical protein
MEKIIFFFGPYYKKSQKNIPSHITGKYPPPATGELSEKASLDYVWL